MVVLGLNLSMRQQRYSQLLQLVLTTSCLAMTTRLQDYRTTGVKSRSCS